MKQSPCGFLRSEISVKKWIENVPSVGTVRPPKCRHCGHASREPGRSLGLYGHGMRTRQLRGPMSAVTAPEEFEIRLRRYQCQRCQATMTVGPAGLLPRLLFTAPAIALALLLWLGGATHAAVRSDVSPWRVIGAAAQVRWNSLIRWARAAGCGRVWPRIQVEATSTPREIARRAVAILANRGPPEGDESARVFAGAEQLR